MTAIFHGQSVETRQVKVTQQTDPCITSMCTCTASTVFNAVLQNVHVDALPNRDTVYWYQMADMGTVMHLCYNAIEASAVLYFVVSGCLLSRPVHSSQNLFI